MNKDRNNTPPRTEQGNMNGNRMNGNGGMQNGNQMNGNGGMQNGNRMNGNGTNTPGNGIDMNGRPLQGSLPEQIRALCFVKTELELYLDTHPTCPTALDYYYRTIRELDRLKEEYANTVGALTADQVITDDGWTWATTPWPWQQAGDFKRERK